MPKHRVLIATPAYSGSVKVDHADSVERLLALAGPDLEFATSRPIAVGVLPRVRNVLAAYAMGQGFTHILFIDDDIGFDAEDVLRMLSHDVGIVAAVPQKRVRRWDEGNPKLAVRLKRDNPSYDEAAGLMEVLDVATAFCLIKTDLMRRMLDAGRVERFVYHTVSRENAPFLAKFFHYPLEPVDPSDAEWAYCESIGIDPATARVDIGEDYAFTRAARAFGERVYVDVGVRLRHWDGCVMHDYAFADEISRIYRSARAAGVVTKEPQRLSVLLPTRGRVESLRRALYSMAATARRPELLEVVLGVDSDDAETLSFALSLRDFPVAVRPCIAARAPTLGRLWDSLASSATGSAVLWMADDFVIEGRNWDDDLRALVEQMRGGLGLAYLPNSDVPDRFVGLPAFSRAMMERLRALQGFLVPPWFPNWFSDTWFDELSTFTGSRHAINARAVGDRPPSHRLRDLGFWLDFFHATRPMREAVARQLLADLYPPEQQARHLALFPERRRLCVDKLAPLSNPATLAALEARAAEFAPDPAYETTMRAARAMLQRLESGEVVAA